MTDDREGRLELPNVLERVDGGIRIRGHRVSLASVLEESFGGTPLPRIKELFPTVPGEDIERVIAFGDRHREAMIAHLAEQRDASGRGRPSSAPSLADLRRRNANRVSSSLRGG